MTAILWALILTGLSVWILFGMLLLLQQYRWYRIRRGIHRDAEQRARLQRIMRATDGR